MAGQMPPPFMPSLGGVVMKSQLITPAPFMVMKVSSTMSIVTMNALKVRNTLKATFSATILRR